LFVFFFLFDFVVSASRSGVERSRDMGSGGDWSFAGGRKGNPELFSRYEVLERIGEGTFGEVYKGRRKADGLIVALKETRDPQCSSREVEALMALAHPNVVQLIEYFMQGPNLVLVLEYLPTDLAQVIQDSSEKPLREAEIKNWMLQILAGVAACHRASILHRDLKPSNLLVAADGSLKIADFGQARRTVSEDGTNWPPSDAGE
jgi:serine/threonine protein kinase